MKDYTGERFGALLALSPHHTDGRRWLWIVRCNCGREKIVQIDKLVAGRIVSCGCGPRRGGGAGHGSYGTTTEWTKWIGTRTYRSWSQMLSRCQNPKHDNYAYYGGAGITVCERWKKFGNFLADMGERPPGTSIDRIDPFGNYEIKNCRWATPKEQGENKRPWGTVAPKKFTKIQA